MNKVAPLVLVLILAACGKSESTETVTSLMAHPDRLREVEQQCADDTNMPAAECNAASKARHRLFLGNGPQYTPPKDVPKF